jgi:glucosamine--fructose-6-phosphate aminotransferase (isomerizing)
MCGIFGIVLNNDENIYTLIFSGLFQLQNRGYDSSGISVINDDLIDVHKYASTDEDSLRKLERIPQRKHVYSGMGHNRWATHGIKNDANAHPHMSNNKKFAIVHNGIIENYHELKQKLIHDGFIFHSQTDTEVIVNLIEFYYTDSTYDAIKKTIQVLRGTYGLVIQSLYEPKKLFCVRNGSPLLIGQNDDMIIITSEQSGFCNRIRTYITLNTDDICTIQDHELILEHNYQKQSAVALETETCPFPYPHWTLKEINSQPEVVLNTINKGGRIKNNDEVKLGGLEQYLDVLKSVEHVILLGCGTSYFAGLYGMHFFKQLCKFSTVQVFDGADFTELDIPNGNTTFILISQSGETKDLHRCIDIAKHKNITTIGIINVVDSLIAREVDCGIYCNAGKEVGVASTKAFTSQVVCLSMASIWFATIQNVNHKKRATMIRDLHKLSNDLKLVLACNDKVQELSKKMVSNHLFLLGKGCDEIIAKEGSLKIKEMSYLHAEGYSSSSLKHGPFALLDETFPVILFNLDQQHLSKTLNCYQEIRSRKSPVLFITNEKHVLDEITCDFILVPKNNTYASLLGILPIQLLAYHLSIQRSINPDKPKNLAKVVTVD